MHVNLTGSTKSKEFFTDQVNKVGISKAIVLATLHCPDFKIMGYEGTTEEFHNFTANVPPVIKDGIKTKWIFTDNINNN